MIVQAHFCLNLPLIYFSAIRSQGKMNESKEIHSNIAFALACKIDNAMSAHETHSATSM